MSVRSSSSSHMTSDFSTNTSYYDPDTKICLLGVPHEKENLVAALQQLGYFNINEMSDVRRLDEFGTQEVVFIVNSFNGEEFFAVAARTNCVLGVPVLMTCLQKRCMLPRRSRPLYCLLMEGMQICFSGFGTNIAECKRLIGLAHWMGAVVKKRIKYQTKVTHLVAQTPTGSNYDRALIAGIPALQPGWVEECWQHGRSVEDGLAERLVTQWSLEPLSFLRIHFYGFEDEEQKHMTEVAQQNGAVVVSADDLSLTHVVFNDFETVGNPFDSRDVHFVRSEWFWASVQIRQTADESLYPYTWLPETPTAITTPTPNKSRKRLLYLESERPNKQRVSYEGAECSPLSPKAKESTKSSHRHQRALEMLQTERNYVAILQTVVKLFREPLENANQTGGAILTSAEVKEIFGNVHVLYGIHQALCEDLESLCNAWKEEASIGAIILKHAVELQKAYPPFINYLESARAAIASHDRSKPRFHAFLKVCQSKPACGRQSLADLMVTPVQRLPRVLLLLEDILKRTPTSMEDHAIIQEAIAALKKVVEHINEDKRRTEDRLAMFDVVRSIHNCPADLLSSHRHLSAKLECVEVSNLIVGRGHPVTLFLFSDCLELCKPRKKPLSSPSLKHVTRLSLLHVEQVLDLGDAQFALICEHGPFALTTEGDKKGFIKELCANIATSLCRPDPESLLRVASADELSLEAHSLTLSRRMKRYASRVVQRATSLHNTPGRLRRALSQLLTSPFRQHEGSPMGKSGEGQ